jgi:TRAP-type transport system periplasmic protein
VSAVEAQEFLRRSRAIEVEWVADMDKRGANGRKLLETARSLIDKHTKSAKA